MDGSKLGAIELTKQARTLAVASIQQYFDKNMPELVGELAAGLLLTFFLEEIGPAVYNRAIADAQARMLQRVGDIEGELFAEEFQYWPRQAAKRKGQ